MVNDLSSSFTDAVAPSAAQHAQPSLQDLPTAAQIEAHFQDLRQRCLMVGLTGGIGSGKSTAAQILQQLGAFVVDADAASHRVTARQGAAMPALIAQFGAQIADPHGALDRALMRALVLRDADSKKQLEALLHPYIETELLRLAHAFLHDWRQTQNGDAAPASARPIVIWDIPLLAESNKWPPRLHRIVCIDCEVATQLARIMARNAHLPPKRQWTEDQAKALIDRQTSRTSRCAIADDIIYNEGIPIEALASRLQLLYARYLTLSTSLFA